MAKPRIDFNLEKNSSLFGLFVIAVSVFAVGIVVAKTLLDVAQFNGRVLSERREVQGVIEKNLEAKDELITNFNKLSEDSLGPDVLFQILPSEYDFGFY